MRTKLCLLAVPVCLFAGAAQADVLDFSTGFGPFTPGYDDYSNPEFSLGNFYMYLANPNGHKSLGEASDGGWYAGGVTSTFYPGYEPLTANLYLIDSSATFTLNSFLIATAYGTQTLHIVGYNNGTQLYFTDVETSQYASLVTLNWAGIDQFAITQGDDYDQTSSFPFEVIQDPTWGLTNLTYEISTNSGNSNVPEPGLLALLGIGIAGLGISRRRKA